LLLSMLRHPPRTALFPYTTLFRSIIGAVIDVEFPRDAVPKVYDALVISESNLTLEVQQQLGDGVVRTIALGSSEGLRRGLTVTRSEEHTSELQSRENLVCRLLLEK